MTKQHPELKAFRRLILNTISKPDSVFFLSKKRDFAAVARFSELVGQGLAAYLVVHYRETTAHDGFMVTAFPMSAKRMNRRFTRWQRLK